MASVLIKGSLNFTVTSEESLVLFDFNVCKLFVIIENFIDYLAIDPVVCALSYSFTEIALLKINGPSIACN